MPLSPERLAAIREQAKQTAAKQVEDPSASTTPTLSSPNELSVSIPAAPVQSPKPSQEELVAAALAVALGKPRNSNATPQTSAPAQQVSSSQSSPQQSSSTSTQNSNADSTQTQSTISSTPPVDMSYPGLFELHERIIALDKALQANHPQFDSLLQTIHRNLDKDAQLLHMLKEEQIATIFRGLKKQTQTMIVEETVKSATRGQGGKGLKNIGLADL